MLRILIDTGSNKNYIIPGLVVNPLPNRRQFFVNSISGDVKITHHVLLDLFGSVDKPSKFFLLPGLRTFDAILGHDTLRDHSAVFYISEGYLSVKGGQKIPIHQYMTQNVNNLNLRLGHLSDCQSRDLLNLVNKHGNLFAEPNDRLTYTTRVVGEIRTNTDNPTYTRNYPYPLALKEVVDKEIKRLLNYGIMWTSRSPYNSPIWVVPKREDASGKRKYRMVVDFRKLNEITIPDKYPIPDINEVLSRLGGNKFFTVIDLRSGFHQIPLKEADIEKTAFSLNNGKYEFTRLPFGLKNAPSIFQRALDDILRNYIGKTCYAYIDHIVIFSKDQESHIKHLDEIFEALDAVNMKLQLDKCEFFKDEVEFLGFIISERGIRTNPKKVEAISRFPYLTTLKELRSLLGLFSYYRRFIRGFASMAKPLTQMLRGSNGRVSKSESSRIRMTLSDVEREFIERLKNARLSKDIILSYPDYEKEFQLTTDASNIAIGAVLSQEDRPITFISRTLSKEEESYATNEREMLAIIWALQNLRNYLYGTAKIVIFTDHQSLTYALSNKNGNTKMKM